MKKFLARGLLTALLLVSTLLALPPVQHERTGLIRAVDTEKRLLVLEPGAKEQPTEFAIVEGRTKLRRDKKPAAFTELAAGQTVQLYYKLEMGRCVATEVNWTSPVAR